MARQGMRIALWCAVALLLLAVYRLATSEPRAADGNGDGKSIGDDGGGNGGGAARAAERRAAEVEALIARAEAVQADAHAAHAHDTAERLGQQRHREVEEYGAETVEDLSEHVHPHCDILAIVPTLPRPGGVDYLSRALRSIVDGVAEARAAEGEASPLTVRVLVYKPAPGQHKAFEEQRNFWVESNKGMRDAQHAKISFTFADLGKRRMLDPFPDRPEPDHRNNPEAVPGHGARQQNCDMLSVVRYALQSHAFRYMLFLEDDFVVCPRGWLRMERALAQLVASREPPLSAIESDDVLEFLLSPEADAGTLPEFIKPDVRGALAAFMGVPAAERIQLAPVVAKQLATPFALLRVSYGMNGLLYHRQDVKGFVDFVQRNLDRLPIDLLVDAYFFPTRAEPERQHMLLRPAVWVNSVLMEHIGQVSTFVERNEANFRPAFPRCDAYVNVTPPFVSLHL